MDNLYFDDKLNSIVAAINEGYETSGLFFNRHGLPRPNRPVIIEVISDLRQLLFPSYFGSQIPNRSSAPYYIGNLMTNIYSKLLHQMELALAYREGIRTDDIYIRAKDVADEFFAELPRIQKLLFIDVEAALNGDPAAGSSEQVIFSYPGLNAIFVHRIAHELYLRDIPYIPRIMSEHIHSKTGIDINPGATIGEYFFIDHGTGVVVGETTVIGDRVKIYQGVTLGALSTRGGQKLRGAKRHPTIEDDVTIYSGASILGGETVVGHDSVIGSNVFITTSIPAETKVSMKDQELRWNQGNEKQIAAAKLDEEAAWFYMI